MDIEAINKQKKAIIEKYGSWTAHNIRLDKDIYTIDNRIVGNEISLRRIVQIVSDISDKSIKNLRILDLACLEGLYAIELAQHGAKVAAIEVREESVMKARFARDMLSLNNLEIIHDDVRNLSKEKYGYFDCVLCLGILYHLDVPDVFYFLEKIAEVCKKFVIIDTHVSMADKEYHMFKGKKYWGRYYIEHNPSSTLEERAKSLWASIDNPKSFWFTRPSLYNLISELGFTSLYECHNPPEIEKQYDRITLLAIKGREETLISSPLVNILPKEKWPEKRKMSVNSSQRWLFNKMQKVKGLLTGPIKRSVKIRKAKTEK